MKYLKTWTTLTTGSYAGRDDGYPIEKSQVFNTLPELARSYGTQKNESYYALQELNHKDLMKAVESSLTEQQERAKEKKKKEIEDKIKKMQNELKALS